MKKAISAIFAALMVISCLVMAGCTEKDPGTQKTDTTAAAETDEVTPAVTEAPEILPDLPDVTFENSDPFVILTQKSGYDADFYTEDHDTGDTLHDAVRLRNNNVCDKYKIQIEVYCEEYSTVNDMIKRSVNSGTHEYDLCFVHMVSGAALAQSNIVLPFEKLEYVDLSKPWWDKAIKNGFSIENNMMMVNGDISPMSFSTTSCIYFNKKLLKAYDIPYPYKLVEEGKWTLDALYELTKDMTVPDGDGNVDARNGKNQFGLASWAYDVPYSFYYAAGGMLITKDPDSDIPEYVPDIERDTNIYNKIYDVIIKNNAYYETDVTYFPNVAKVFADGRALFYDAKLSSAEELRDMDDEFGILPVPKYSEKQEDYYSFVNGSSSMVCVPTTCRTQEMRDRTSILIEAFAYESYKIVTPALIETYLKRKVTRDADSQDMIDYIIRNRVFDMAYVNMHDGIGSFVRDLLTKKSTNVSSELGKYTKNVPKKIDKIVQAFEKSLKAD